MYAIFDSGWVRAAGSFNTGSLLLCIAQQPAAHSLHDQPATLPAAGVPSLCPVAVQGSHDTQWQKASIHCRVDDADMGGHLIRTGTMHDSGAGHQLDIMNSMPSSNAEGDVGQSSDHVRMESTLLRHSEHRDGAKQNDHFLPVFMWQLLDGHDLSSVDLPPSLSARSLPCCEKCSPEWGV